MKDLKPRQTCDYLQRNPDAMLVDRRSGQRLVDTGVALEQAGFGEVINVLQGFERPLDEHYNLSEWRQEGLRWEQT